MPGVQQLLYYKKKRDIYTVLCLNMKLWIVPSTAALSRCNTIIVDYKCREIKGYVKYIKWYQWNSVNPKENSLSTEDQNLLKIYTKVKYYLYPGRSLLKKQWNLKKKRLCTQTFTNKKIVVLENCKLWYKKDDYA